MNASPSRMNAVSVRCYLSNLLSSHKMTHHFILCNPFLVKQSDNNYRTPEPVTKPRRILFWNTFWSAGGIISKIVSSRTTNNLKRRCLEVWKIYNLLVARDTHYYAEYTLLIGCLFKHRNIPTLIYAFIVTIDFFAYIKIAEHSKMFWQWVANLIWEV